MAIEQEPQPKQSPLRDLIEIAQFPGGAKIIPFDLFEAAIQAHRYRVPGIKGLAKVVGAITGTTITMGEVLESLYRLPEEKRSSLARNLHVASLKMIEQYGTFRKVIDQMRREGKVYRQIDIAQALGIEGRVVSAWISRLGYTPIMFGVTPAVDLRLQREEVPEERDITKELRDNYAASIAAVKEGSAIDPERLAEEMRARGYEKVSSLTVKAFLNDQNNKELIERALRGDQ